MRMNHAQLAVSDVAANRAFFETYFGLRCIADRGDTLAVMVDGGSILAFNNFKKRAEVAYPDIFLDFHIGFGQESRERVDEIHASLKAGGLEPDNPREFHGAWTFYIKAPGGFFVEVFHQHRVDEE